MKKLVLTLAAIASLALTVPQADAGHNGRRYRSVRYSNGEPVYDGRPVAVGYAAGYYAPYYGGYYAPYGPYFGYPYYSPFLFGAPGFGIVIGGGHHGGHFGGHHH